jgi:NitT/TauT family transport system ATP-binding protein
MESSMDTRRFASSKPSAPPAAPLAVHALGVGKAFRSKRGQDFVALSNVSIDIPVGEFVCLIGPSGCGKSTFLNLVAGLIPLSSGHLEFMGSPLNGVNTGLGYITQADTLLPWSTVRKNVTLGLAVQGIGTRAERRTRVEEMLTRVGLRDFADHYPSQLSGGMRKRAVLARTLVYEPPALLMDEPFGALDAQMRTELQGQLLTLWAEHRSSVLFVTHDLDEAIILADKIVVFGSRPGRIIDVIQNDLPRPRTVDQLRGSPDFAEMWRTLWMLIHNDDPSHRSEQR